MAPPVSGQSVRFVESGMPPPGRGRVSEGVWSGGGGERPPGGGGGVGMGDGDRIKWSMQREGGGAYMDTSIACRRGRSRKSYRLSRRRGPCYRRGSRLCEGCRRASRGR